MKIFVQTRGKTADYAFLGRAPSHFWWQEFRDATSFEQPTLIVSGDGKKWRCFLSGIPSIRLDRVGTPIRYSIAMDGQCGIKAETVLSLLAAWLADATSDTPRGNVQAALDYAFDEASVERLVNIRGATIESADEVERLAFKALSKLAMPKTFVGKEQSESWVGSTTSLDARNELLARCSQLIFGGLDGNAAVLNLLGNVDEAAVFARKFNSIAALIETDDLRSIVPLEKKNPDYTRRPIISNPRPSVPWTLIGVVLGVILLVILMRTCQAPQENHSGDQEINLNAQTQKTQKSE